MAYDKNMPMSIAVLVAINPPCIDQILNRVHKVYGYDCVDICMNESMLKNIWCLDLPKEEVIKHHLIKHKV